MLDGVHWTNTWIESEIIGPDTQTNRQMKFTTAKLVAADNENGNRDGFSIYPTDDEYCKYYTPDEFSKQLINVLSFLFI